jgi:hypothetical protein
MTVCKCVANTGKGATMKGGGSGAGNEAFEVKGDMSAMMRRHGQTTGLQYCSIVYDF